MFPEKGGEALFFIRTGIERFRRDERRVENGRLSFWKDETINRSSLGIGNWQEISVIKGNYH